MYFANGNIELSWQTLEFEDQIYQVSEVIGVSQGAEVLGACYGGPRNKTYLNYKILISTSICGGFKTLTRVARTQNVKLGEVKDKMGSRITSGKKIQKKKKKL